MSTAAAAKRLAGKTVLVTGASSGIGRATALEFARTAPSNGLRIIVTARTQSALSELKDQIATEVGDGVQVLPVALDVSDPAAVRGFVGSLPEEWRDIHVLVNNA
jgi:3-hydroxy acid dehydrogenase / malonic semialdehyde reductase